MGDILQKRPIDSGSFEERDLQPPTVISHGVNRRDVTWLYHLKSHQSRCTTFHDQHWLNFSKVLYIVISYGVIRSECIFEKFFYIVKSHQSRRTTFHDHHWHNFSSISSFRMVNIREILYCQVPSNTQKKWNLDLQMSVDLSARIRVAEFCGQMKNSETKWPTSTCRWRTLCCA